MSESRTVNCGGSLWGLFFWGFVVTKVAGHVFAAWSWWWLLLPIIPWLGLLVQKANL